MHHNIYIVTVLIIDKLFDIFAFFCNKHNNEIVFDSSKPEMDHACFDQEDYSNTVYGDFSENILPNAPKYRGFGLKIRVYVDSDHTSDFVTRRSRTGFIVFLNSAPIYCTPKKYGSIETISFASDFISMKTFREYICGLRYKF